MLKHMQKTKLDFTMIFKDCRWGTMEMFARINKAGTRVLGWSGDSGELRASCGRGETVIGPIAGEGMFQAQAVPLSATMQSFDGGVKFSEPVWNAGAIYRVEEAIHGSFIMAAPLATIIRIFNLRDKAIARIENETKNDGECLFYFSERANPIYHSFKITRTKGGL